MNYPSCQKFVLKLCRSWLKSWSLPYLLALLAWACCQNALADRPVTSPEKYTIDLHHTSWTTKEGAPAYIIGITQTADGWLWLAASNGLFRFDGVTFERFHATEGKLLSNNLWAMRVLSSGALWIGYRSGGASEIKEGKIKNFGASDGLPSASVADFEEDAAGRLWVATSRGMLVFDGKRWSKPDPAIDAPRTYCTLLSDHQHTLWAQCEDGAYELAAGDHHFVKRPAPEGIGRLFQDRDKTVWSVGGSKGAVTALAGPGLDTPAPLWPAPRAGGGTMLFDRDGEHVWMSRSDGVARVNSTGVVEEFGTTEGLSGTAVNFILQDREGNVWVGTENGLDRFRRQALSGVLLPQVYSDSTPIAAAAEGALWVGKTLLNKPDRAAFSRIPLGASDNSDTVSVMWSESPDSVWIAARDGLWHQQGKNSERIALPEGVVPSLNIYAMVRDRAGDLWISVRSRGVFRRHNGVWEADSRFKDFTPVKWMYLDAQGRIWFTGSGSRIACLADGKLSFFGASEGLEAGSVLQIMQIDSHIWVGGENGLFYLDGTRFQHVLGTEDEGLYGISGMMYVRGKLWLNGMGGITSLDGSELKRAISDAGYRVRYSRFDHRDGLRGSATQSAPLPSAIAGSDGKLWFATTAGIFWMNPVDTVKNILPPPVYIRGIISAGTLYPVDGKSVPRIAPRPARIQINYTALSLTMPERMKFLYRLDGVDNEWQDGGTLRSTTYTDLGPGAYRFRVKAANNDGVWSTDEAVVNFYVEPTLYQTMWFRLMCGIVVGLSLWGIYRFRLAQVASQVKKRLEERQSERERIARELHDTFLQTVYALILKIDNVFHRLPVDEPVKAELERSLNLAEQAFSEARDCVKELRTSLHEQQQFVVAVTAIVSGAFTGPTRLVTQSSGTLRRFKLPVFEELYAIAREALLNAARHARASEVVFKVTYGTDAFTMLIVDDGKGIDADVLKAGQRSGHYGLPGMRERAVQIGAAFSITSTEQDGTRIRLILPARLAYEAELRG